jgi:putative RecB family exonuclease
MSEFKNEYLSYSRLDRFETCPLSFKLHYIDKYEPGTNMSLRFGKIIHAVLEQLYQEVINQEYIGPLSEKRALDLYSQVCLAEGLTGISIFEEGATILRNFVHRQGVVDHRTILAVEKEFLIQVGSFRVKGFIDRVDVEDDETVTIRDYKTNRMLFTREEVDSSLQLSLYQHVAHQLWPWAKKVKLAFEMLRHDIVMETSRTPEQLDAATQYIETLGRMTEETEAYEPKLNNNCIYCDHRTHCPAYNDALAGKKKFVCVDESDLEAVAKEREEVSHIAKIAYDRKQVLEKILKARLKEQDELVLNGMRYRMFNTVKNTYPLEKTLQTMERFGLDREELLKKIVGIDNKALDAYLKKLGKDLDKPRFTLLKAELGAVVKKSFSPRFWAKKEVSK